MFIPCTFSPKKGIRTPFPLTTILCNAFFNSYRYLPGDIAVFKREEQLEGTFLFFATKTVISRILRWVVSCALTKPCIAPTDELKCKFHPGDSFNFYANCHRFDQSAFSITMLNHFNLSARSYYSSQRTIIINRSPAKDKLIDDCVNGTFKEVIVPYVSWISWYLWS